MIAVGPSSDNYSAAEGVTYYHHRLVAFALEVIHSGQQVHNAASQSVRFAIVEPKRGYATTSELFGQPSIGPWPRSAETATGPAHPYHALVGAFGLVQYPFDASQVRTEQKALARASIMGWTVEDPIDSDF